MVLLHFKRMFSGSKSLFINIKYKIYTNAFFHMIGTSIFPHFFFYYCHYPSGPPPAKCLVSPPSPTSRRNYHRSTSSMRGIPAALLVWLYPPPSPRGCPTPTPRRDRTFFAPLLTRHEKNWGVSNAQGVEGPHFFCTVVGIGQGGEGTPTPLLV